MDGESSDRMTQEHDPMTLFDHLPRTIQQRFEDWLAAHPGVMEEFVRIARTLKSRDGHDRYSSDGILHILRWEGLVQRADGEKFRCNNVFSSRLARLAMQQHPDLAGFFETRSLKSE